MKLNIDGIIDRIPHIREVVFGVRFLRRFRLLRLGANAYRKGRIIALAQSHVIWLLRTPIQLILLPFLALALIIRLALIVVEWLDKIADYFVCELSDHVVNVYGHITGLWLLVSRRDRLNRRLSNFAYVALRFYNREQLTKMEDE